MNIIKEIKELHVGKVLEDYTLKEQCYIADAKKDTDDLEEIGLIAYNFIGNKNTFLQSVIIDVDCNTGIA